MTTMQAFQWCRARHAKVSFESDGSVDLMVGSFCVTVKPRHGTSPFIEAVKALRGVRARKEGRR
jgi:hypothetical protein